jgi:transposase-like protein
LVLGDIKNRVAEECMSANVKEMQMFCEKVLAEYTKEKWQNCCFHMKKTEEEYWQQGGSMDEAVNSMIIHLGESSDYTSTDEEEFWSSSEDE